MRGIGFLACKVGDVHADKYTTLFLYCIELVAHEQAGVSTDKYLFRLWRGRARTAWTYNNVTNEENSIEASSQTVNLDSDETYQNGMYVLGNADAGSQVDYKGSLTATMFNLSGSRYGHGIQFLK